MHLVFYLGKGHIKKKIVKTQQFQTKVLLPYFLPSLDINPNTITNSLLYIVKVLLKYKHNWQLTLGG
jgi:hypothetical protein